MVQFINQQSGVHAVSVICSVLPISPSTYYGHVRRAAGPACLSARGLRDAELLPLIGTIWEEGRERYGAK